MKQLIIFILIFFCQPLLAQKSKSVIEEELEKLHNISLLPQYRSGTKMAMVSSYDTTGGNDDGFSGKYSYIRKEGENRVVAELEGPGVIHRMWIPIPTEDTIKFYFDGEDEPRINIKFQDLFFADIPPFVSPLVGQEIGGYFNYVPIPYSKSCKIIYVGEGLKFFQIQYSTFENDKEVASFDMELSSEEKAAFNKVSDLWENYKNIDVEQITSSKSIKTIQKSVLIKPGEYFDLINLSTGGRILGVEIENTEIFQSNYNDLILQAKWDNEEAFAINVPVAQFFGYAFGQRSAQSLLLGSKSDLNYCYFPMPFDKNADFNFYYQKRPSINQPVLSFNVKIYYSEEKRNPQTEGKLYTAWRRSRPEKGVPYTILKQTGRGHHIGTLLWCQSIEEEEVAFPTGFFEGDDVTTIDGEVRMHGTGSEDYFNGGWYGVPDRWDDAVSLPLHGSLEYSVPLARTGGYRLKLTDKVPFEKSYELTIEHGPQGNDWEVDYESLALYYGDTPPQEVVQPSLELTEVPHPEKMEIYLNFFDINAFGFNSAPSSLSYNRIDNKEVFILASENNWTSIKTDLNVPVDGEFDLFISYFKSPESGRLRLFQRQKPLTDWIDISSDTTEFVHKQHFAKIKIVEGNSSVTFQTNSDMGGSKFILHRIYLERTDKE